MKLKNFGGLVLFCIDADFCVQILIFSIFRDLQDSKPFAPLETQNFAKFYRNFSEFCQFLSREYLILAGKMFDFSYWECLILVLIFK